jgi:hypothetical protein
MTDFVSLVLLQAWPMFFADIPGQLLRDSGKEPLCFRRLLVTIFNEQKNGQCNSMYSSSSPVWMA